jgi:hypothetical protein
MPAALCQVGRAGLWYGNPGTEELCVKRNWNLVLGLILALAIVTWLAACGPERPTTVQEPTAIEQATATAAPTAAEESSPDAPAKPTASGDAVITDTGLQYIEIKAGDGPAAEPGKVVKVHYRGSLEDGTEFDNSYDRGEPITFALFRARLLPAGMKAWRP